MNNKSETQDFALHISNGLLYDELHRYAREYSLPVERLTELAVKRLVSISNCSETSGMAAFQSISEKHRG